MAYDALTVSQCSTALQGMQDTLYVLSGKWKLPIILALREGNRRFGELQKAVKGIAAKVLSHELKELEANGFLKRTVHSTMPVTVEYELTPYSDSLNEVIHALVTWGINHRKHMGLKVEHEIPEPA